MVCGLGEGAKGEEVSHVTVSVVWKAKGEGVTCDGGLAAKAQQGKG